MNCLQLNNPDVSFEKSPTDMAKRGQQLFICCQNHPIVYAVNTKTFEWKMPSQLRNTRILFH